MVLKKFWSGLVLGLVVAGIAGMAHAEEKSVKRRTTTKSRAKRGERIDKDDVVKER